MSIPTIAALAATGNAIEKRFREHVNDQRCDEFKAVLGDLHAWLQRCVEQGRYLPSGSADRRNVQGQLDYWTSRLLQLGLGFDDVDRIEEFNPEAGHVLPATKFPYHGLLAATPQADKPFFGREQETREYADHLEQHAALLIQSESGGGKSSVAMAGVLPELRRRHADWLVLARVTPGTQPADGLRAALAELLALPPAIDTAAMPAAVQTALTGRTLLVYVDQLEELLTMCTDVRQQQDFSSLLAELAEAQVLRLLATMRIDHYSRLARSHACHPLFALLTRDGSVKTLLPMSLAQLRQVIQKPADGVGLRFVPASIVETLASETANAPGGLPLLQFALQRLWDERPREGGRADRQPLDMVREDTLAKLPTLRTALSTVAETYFTELSKRGLADAGRRLMLELTVIDETLEVPLRRRRVQAEVMAVLTGAGLAEADAAQELVDGLVHRRLLVRTGEGPAQQLEVAHEALFRHWPRFQDWLDSDDSRATLRETRQVTREALLWEQAERSPELLNLRGERLDSARRLLRERWLEALPAHYVSACETAAKERARDESRQRLFSRLGLAASVMAITAAGFTLWAKQKSDQAELAASSGAAFMLAQLRPGDALNLAYTMRKLGTPESLANLALAMDISKDYERVGAREDGAAFFTTSGQAVFQFIKSDDGQRFKAARIRMLGSALRDLGPPVEVHLAAADDAAVGDDVAQLDVGPEFDDGNTRARLVVVGYIGQPGKSGDRGRLLTRLRIHRIETAASGNLRVVGAAELNYPEGTRTTSEVAFDRSGRHLAWVVRGSEAGAVSALRWSVGDPSGQARRLALPDKDVSAIAFVQGKEDRLVFGHRNGRLSCASGAALPLADWTQVEALRTSSGGTQFLARHENNSLTVGDCATGQSFRIKEPGFDMPDPVAIRAGRTGGNSRAESGSDVSYVLGGKLICVHLPYNAAAGDRGQSCGSHDHDRAAVAAYPVTDVSGMLLGYRIFETDEPWIRFVDMSGGERGADLQPAAGLTVANAPPEADQTIVAQSPNRQHRVGIRSSKDDALSVLRWPQPEGPPRVAPVKDPMFAAVRDDGLAVVLASRASDKPHLLSMVDGNGKVLASSPTFVDAACLRLAPDGQHALVASDGGTARLLALGAGGVQLVGDRPGNSDPTQDPVRACAAGNGPRPTIAVGTRSGVVKVHSGEPSGWHTVSELVWFSLNGASALDVSIDGDSRFVAAVSVRLERRCRDGADGHLLRIWDLKQKRPEYPVASTCINRDVRKLGAIAREAGGWVLPIYFNSNETGADKADSLKLTNYRCRACTDKPGSHALGTLLDQDAEAAGAERLKPEDVSAKYGIRL